MLVMYFTHRSTSYMIDIRIYGDFPVMCGYNFMLPVFVARGENKANNSPISFWFLLPKNTLLVSDKIFDPIFFCGEVWGRTNILFLFLATSE